MYSPIRKIAWAGASLIAPDFCRDFSVPSQLQLRANMMGARGMTCDNAASDGKGFRKEREMVLYEGPSKKGWNAICEIGTNDWPDVVVISGDLAWNSSFTNADYDGQPSTFQQQTADALAFKNALSGFTPPSKQVYLSIIPPETINYGGAVWKPYTSTWKALDQYCQTLWPGAVISIDYATYVATLGTMDGIHEAYGVNLLFANDVFWGLQQLGVDLGTLAPNYPPYDGSQGSVAICQNIQKRNTLGLAFLSSNNIDPARIPAGISPAA